MDKGYYHLQHHYGKRQHIAVAIHNKNGQGLLRKVFVISVFISIRSQSTIKMDKGYYEKGDILQVPFQEWSQSTIKMDKGYYNT